MIPLLLKIHLRWDGHRLRLWIPLFIAWLLLLPVVAVLLPLVVVVCLLMGNNPFRALSAGWQMLTGLRGTHVEVDDSQLSMLLHVW